MAEDILTKLFDGLAAAELPVPAMERVVARGQVRRRRARIGAGAAVVAVAVLAGSAVAYAQHLTGEPATRRAGASRPVPSPTTMTPLPTGPGQLVLGTSGQGFAISRLGSKAKPIEVPGLAADRASGSLVVANPAGGWVVVYATAPAGAGGQQPTRLATVSIAGVVRPFGESFGRQSAPTGLAVRPDGSAVAVAVPSPTGTSRIDLVPLPGHAGAARSWIMPRGPGATTLGVEQVAVSLSFEPNGAALTYLPAAETGGGLTNDGAVTLDITAPGRIAPITSGWPAYSKKPGTCALVAGAWDGHTYVALEQCNSDYVLRPVAVASGASLGPSVRVPVPWGCNDSAVYPALPAGQQQAGQILIEACGTFLDSRGHVTTLRGLPDGAVWAGGQ